MWIAWRGLRRGIGGGAAAGPEESEEAGFDGPPAGVPVGPCGAGFEAGSVRVGEDVGCGEGAKGVKRSG